MSNKVRIGLLGLGFGAEFIPIYQAHPNAELVAVGQRSEDSLNRMADHFGIEGRYTSLDAMLEDENIDAIHLNSPIQEHADQTVKVLDAGKHVACTVPMATSIEDCWRIVDAQQRSGRTYMMMETAVYTREFLYARSLLDGGDLGRIQFLRGAHMQEMAGWPAYWRELPPMHYATHAVAPLLALAGAEAESVTCVGSGSVRRDDGSGGPSFAVQSALFKLRESDLAMEVTRSLYDVAREYVESFDVYGSKMTYEWQQLEREDPVVFTGEQGNRARVPDFAHLLPEQIRQYTIRGVYDEAENHHLSFTQGSGHGGSHPHLAHEFASAIIEGRKPLPDVFTSANWTAAGIAAHESSMTGKPALIPSFQEGRRG